MINKISLYEQIKETMASHVEGEELTTAQIITEVNAHCGTNKGSIIPTDYCYNRNNNGIDFDKRPKLFLYVNRGHLKYVGEHYDYAGNVFHQSKGEGIEKAIGRYEKGRLIRDEKL